ncbi:family 1 encapsulin nanocompartment shell protein [Sandaracinus amylolyticus]|uniref:family 1 encapsulin nanocompartment shell protein n=1 Tax=Sandaracinus amylolyticus TaxID=927083 RepID=UPI001F1DB7C4|nr:family 1 encapsulin nanocompartment shell protein [Sandaracinus amylolyticus]UJR81172.1 Bacteriocin [Sandaracinus amylolyticus]
MNLLKRELAPITPEAWGQIDAEARRVLNLHLAARKVVDFKGPLGWEKGAVNTGRLSTVDAPLDHVSARVRVVLPLVELRTYFELPIDELDDASRGADDLDFKPLIEAAARIARAEDHAVFNGYPAAGIHGVIESSEHAPVSLAHAHRLPFAVVEAKEVLRRAGVDGPYALVLGPRLYDETQAAAEDGYPIRSRVEPLIDSIVWAPALEHGALVSMRGGDFELTVGQDLSIGYASHDQGRVRLYLTESLTFRVLETTAAVPLRRT